MLRGVRALPEFLAGLRALAVNDSEKWSASARSPLMLAWYESLPVEAEQIRDFCGSECFLLSGRQRAEQRDQISKACLG